MDFSHFFLNRKKNMRCFKGKQKIPRAFCLLVKITQLVLLDNCCLRIPDDLELESELEGQVLLVEHSLQAYYMSHSFWVKVHNTSLHNKPWIQLHTGMYVNMWSPRNTTLPGVNVYLFMTCTSVPVCLGLDWAQLSPYNYNGIFSMWIGPYVTMTMAMLWGVILAPPPQEMGYIFFICHTIVSTDHYN